jgi:hypothetical protein
MGFVDQRCVQPPGLIFVKFFIHWLGVRLNGLLHKGPRLPIHDPRQNDRPIHDAGTVMQRSPATCHAVPSVNSSSNVFLGKRSYA